MCLKNLETKKLIEPKNWVIGYKVLQKTQWGTLLSWYANQEWEFAELVKAQKPEEVGFSGARSSIYEEGIHAWKTFASARKGALWFESNFIVLIVKVLLFNVTHEDDTAYKAEYGIVIDTFNFSKKRIPWPGG